MLKVSGLHLIVFARLTLALVAPGMAPLRYLVRGSTATFLATVSEVHIRLEQALRIVRLQALLLQSCFVYVLLLIPFKADRCQVPVASTEELAHVPLVAEGINVLRFLPVVHLQDVRGLARAQSVLL